MQATQTAPARTVARTRANRPEDQLVLVVDDNDDIRGVEAQALEMGGYRVSTAANGKVALELAHAHRPNLILLDLMMPVMSGWEFLEALREVPDLASVPVVVVTALDDAYPEGAVAFMRKPFLVETLLATVAWASDGEELPLQ